MNIFKTKFSKEVEKESRAKYEPIRLTEDEALKRNVVGSGAGSSGAAGKRAEVKPIDEAVPYEGGVMTYIPGVHCEENKTQSIKRMSESERADFARVVQNFNEEEFEIILEYMPVEMCFSRIKAEIDRAKLFESTIKNIVSEIR